MEIARASASAYFIRGFAGRDWSMPLLTMRDIGELQREVPLKEGRAFATIFEVAEWAKTVEGSDAILWRCMRRIEGHESMAREDVQKHGSLAQRTRLASAIAMESMLSGEEEEADEGGQKKSTAQETG